MNALSVCTFVAPALLTRLNETFCDLKSDCPGSISEKSYAIDESSYEFGLPFLLAPLVALLLRPSSSTPRFKPRIEGVADPAGLLILLAVPGVAFAEGLGLVFAFHPFR